MSIDRERIARIADKVRISLKIEGPPYNPLEAIGKLGGEIVVSEGRIIYDRLGIEWDASIEKIGDSFIIHLAESDNKVRKRFTIAHELGHLFLHMGFILDEAKWDSLKGEDGTSPNIFYRDNSSSLEEYEAHEFAASFLMPKKEFIDIAEEYLQNNIYDVEGISKRFDVSLSAANNRGKWLGIFQW